jgi:signal peptidase I
MNPSSFQYRFWIYLLASLGALVAALFAYLFVFRYPIWTLHAFVVPSGSFCPTICKGERVLARMQFGAPYVPKRGDVILFRYGADQVNYLKRVIGLPGDVVAPGPGNTILVNGRLWQPPAVCAKKLLTSGASQENGGYPFPLTKVPAGQMFVIGDNLNNSFDSPFADFGPVTPDKVTAKPVLIYWSPEASRIGCPVR